MSWKIALRHLFRNSRLNLLLLVIMILGASLLASLPMLAVTIAGESLSLTLESAPVQDRNILLQGKSWSSDLPDEFEQSLGFLQREMIAVREGDVIGSPLISKSDGNQLNLYPATVILNLWSFDRLDERVRVLQGHLPESGQKINAEESAYYEAVIGSQASLRSGLELGDEVTPATGTYRLRIVGIVEPLDPNAEI